MRVVAGLLAFALALYALATGALLMLEDSFIYFPQRGGRITAPGRELWLRASDGVRIHAFLAGDEGARHTLLYLHGNAGNLAGRSEILEWFASLGVRVLAIDYRGYGQSEGKPSEDGLYADALAAFDWIAAHELAHEIVVLGESLGGGPACEVASKRPVGGLVLLSTFTSVPDMASRTFPLLPVRLLVRTRFDNLGKIARIEVPKLIVHSRRDEVIPFEMGQRLARAAKPPVQTLWLDRSFHNDAYFVEDTRLRAALRAFFASLPSAR